MRCMSFVTCYCTQQQHIFCEGLRGVIYGGAVRETGSANLWWPHAQGTAPWCSVPATQPVTSTGTMLNSETLVLVSVACQLHRHQLADRTSAERQAPLLPRTRWPCARSLQTHGSSHLLSARAHDSISTATSAQQTLQEVGSATCRGSKCTASSSGRLPKARIKNFDRGDEIAHRSTDRARREALLAGRAFPNCCSRYESTLR